MESEQVIPFSLAPPINTKSKVPPLYSNLNRPSEFNFFEFYDESVTNYRAKNVRISSGEKFRLHKRRETIKSIRFLR